MLDRLAAKADLHQLRAGMSQEFAAIRGESEARDTGPRKDLKLLSATMMARFWVHARA
jgi:hypothetical protein